MGVTWLDEVGVTPKLTAAVELVVIDVAVVVVEDEVGDAPVAMVEQPVNKHYTYKMKCLRKSHPPDTSVSSSSQGGPGLCLTGPLQ